MIFANELYTPNLKRKSTKKVSLKDIQNEALINSIKDRELNSKYIELTGNKSKFGTSKYLVNQNNLLNTL